MLKRTSWSFLVVVLLAGLLASGAAGVGASSGAAAGPPDGNGLDRAIAVQNAHTEELLKIQGVVGTGVGFGADGPPVIVIYTVAAGVAGLPSSLDGVPVDVVVTGMIVALTDPTARQPRPVPIGVSTGHPDITAGTIGARVTDGTDVYALSNNHVYANTNKAELGDSALQPGPFDGGEDPADKIGELFDFEPILFDGSDNTIDAAIAISSTDLLGNSTPTDDDGYGTPNSITVSAFVNQVVQKYGRTTGLTQGTVSEVNVTVNVCYKSRGPFFCDSKFIAKFVNQIAISPGDFSAGGDSGSLIVTNDGNKNPVGLLFAGSSTRTIANRIDLVLGRFGVTIDDSAPGAPGAADPSTSTITADPTSIPANGTSNSTITVQLKDANGNNLTGGGDTVELFTDLGSLGPDPVVTDNGDGTYTATLTAGTTAGTATVTGTLNGVPMTDTATVEFTAPAAADPSKSTITADPTSLPADGTSNSTITVQLKDANGLNLTSGGDEVALSTDRGSLGSVTDNGNGTYTATLTAGTTAGTATVTGTLNGVPMTDTATVEFTAPAAETLTITKATYNSRKGQLKVEATSSLGGLPNTSLTATFFVGGVATVKDMDYNPKKDKWSVTFTSVGTTKPDRVEVCSTVSLECTETTDIGGK